MAEIRDVEIVLHGSSDEVGPRMLVVIGSHPEIAIFQPSHASLKMVHSSWVWPHQRGNWGYMEIGLKNPVIGG